MKKQETLNNHFICSMKRLDINKFLGLFQRKIKECETILCVDQIMTEN